MLYVILYIDILFTCIVFDSYIDISFKCIIFDSVIIFYAYLDSVFCLIFNLFHN